jgi:hypothetical protein
MDFNDAFNRIAGERGVDATELRAQLDAAIHEAFSSDDVAVREWFAARFGEREPSLEELVAAIGEQIEAELGNGV